MIAKQSPTNQGDAAKSLTPPSLLLVLLAALPLAAGATIVIDPDGVGATAVFANSADQILVGFGGTDGSVRVDAGGGLTAATGTALLISDETATGTVRIIGDGSAASATVTINDGANVRVGRGNAGTLEVRNGGLLTSNESIHFGEESFPGGVKGSSTVIVDGTNAVVRSSNATEGGRLFMPFGYADANVTVSNGGRVEALGGDLSTAPSADGSIFIGYEEDKPVNVVVNVTGETSTLYADHGLYMRSGFGSTVVNVLDGASAIVANPYEITIGSDTLEFSSVGINSLDGNATLNIEGMSSGGLASHLDVAGGIDIGSIRPIAGFTAAGEPRYSYDSSAIANGVQVIDSDGNPLFYPDSSPVLGETVDFGGGFTVVLPESFALGSSDSIPLRTPGHLTVADGAEVISGGDINISQNADPSDPPVVPSFNGSKSTLEVNSGGSVHAQTVYINEDGRLLGNGGLIAADIVVDGGTLAPGSSPGTLTIDGNLDVFDGVLELEADSETLMDLLVVSGDVNIGADSMIELILGYVPPTGLAIEDFFDVTGLFNVDDAFDPLADILLSFTDASGVSEGDMVSISLGNEVVTYEYIDGQVVIVGDDGSVPAPATLVLLGLGLAGIGYQRRKQIKAA